MQSVGVRELKEHTHKILRQVREKHEEIQVTYRGKVIARLVPVKDEAAFPGENMEPIWTDLDNLAQEIGAKWQEGVTARGAVDEIRRDL